ncbi:hypothetical protein [Falsiroseomonas tokyonensis]|uniref:Phage holin family protein n=1 Tax=Falsiroseomonas tokyonensis TaxID=430521 RepID=A0ABV7C2D7_9PROT|nr:hypothetical protein [Falsiroseomonas tokyonensis]MBU8541248.1 hypothetical protein [Falsiroseomonas tokyonensis]
MADEVPNQQLIFAKEALRQAEIRLQSQATALAAVETRAGALIGWAMAGVAAAIAALLTLTTSMALGIGAAVFLAGLVASIVAALQVLLPGSWDVPGNKPADLEPGAAMAEAVLLRWVTDGLGAGIDSNSDRLATASRSLRWAYSYFAVTPIIAAVAFALVALAS